MIFAVESLVLGEFAKILFPVGTISQNAHDIAVQLTELRVDAIRHLNPEIPESAISKIHRLLMLFVVKYNTHVYTPV